MLQDLGLSDPSLSFFLYDKHTLGRVTPHSGGSPPQLAQYLLWPPLRPKPHPHLSKQVSCPSLDCLLCSCHSLSSWLIWALATEGSFPFQAFLGPHRALAKGWGSCLANTSHVLGNAHDPVQAKVRRTFLTPSTPQKPADEQGGFSQDSSFV